MFAWINCGGNGMGDKKDADTATISESRDLEGLKNIFTKGNKKESYFILAVAAFALTAFYGFYLINGVIGALNGLSISVSSIAVEMREMKQELVLMRTDMNTMTASVGKMTTTVNETMIPMTEAVKTMTVTTQNLDKKIGGIEGSFVAMVGHVEGIRRYFHGMLNEVFRIRKTTDQAGRPMSFMNSFMPW